jgi:drug/metabolite transporter (DMT)-like permease
MPTRTHILGITYGIIASVLWGTVNVCGRTLVDRHHLDPIFVGGLRFTSGALLATLFLLATRQSGRLRLAARELPLLAGLGAVGIFGMGACVFLAARYTLSINASVLLNTNPIFIVLLAPLVGEHPRLPRVLGVVIGLAGAVVIGLGGETTLQAGRNDLLGCAFALLSGLCWASYTVFGKGVAARRGGLPAATLSLLCGAAVYWPFIAAFGLARPLTPLEIALALYLGLGPTAVSMLLWYKALEHTDATVLGPTQYLAILVGTLLGWLLLGEPIGLPLLVGAAAICLALWLVTRPQDSPAPRGT